MAHNKIKKMKQKIPQNSDFAFVFLEKLNAYNPAKIFKILSSITNYVVF